MKIKLWTLALAAVTIAGCSKDDDDDNSQDINATDREFAMRASMGNRAEIAAGTIALLKGTDQDITDFGREMTTDHGTSIAQLHDIADDLNLYSPDSLDMENVMLAQQLDTLSGRSFDSVYIKSQVTAHQKTIALFQNEIDNGNNVRLTGYATGQMPTLQMHLQESQGIAADY